MPPSLAVCKVGVAEFPAQKDVIGAIFTEGAAIIVIGGLVHVFVPQGFVMRKVTTYVPICAKMIVGFGAVAEGEKLTPVAGDTDHVLVIAPTD